MDKIEDKDKIKRFLITNKGYLKKGATKIAERLDINDLNLVLDVLKTVKKEIKEIGKVEAVASTSYSTNIITNKHQNVLVIGDLHSPWILPNYLEWCYELGKEYKTNKTIFIGDVVDGHSWNFHEHDVDGMSVGHELDAAIKHLKPAYKMFPEAEVMLGNHDLLIARKIKSAGLSQRFIKNFKDIIEAPKDWNFAHQVKYHDVNYLHGSIGNAFKRACDSRTSTVQGHLHSQSFVQYSVSEKDAIWGLQIGCGLDHTKYAFEYAQPMTKKPIISAGVVLNNGELPILRLMKL